MRGVRESENAVWSDGFDSWMMAFDGKLDREMSVDESGGLYLMQADGLLARWAMGNGQ